VHDAICHGPGRFYDALFASPTVHTSKHVAGDRVVGIIPNPLDDFDLLRKGSKNRSLQLHCAIPDNAVTKFHGWMLRCPLR